MHDTGVGDLENVCVFCHDETEVGNVCSSCEDEGRNDWTDDHPKDTQEGSPGVRR